MKFDLPGSFPRQVFLRHAGRPAIVEQMGTGIAFRSGAIQTNEKPTADRKAVDSCAISCMDQRSLNEAVQQALDRCLRAPEPLGALNSFLGRLKHSGSWTEEKISHVENATRRILAIIFEPSSAEDARAEDRPGRHDQ